MKWFGADWGAPCCDAADHVDTPTDTTCGYCGLAIKADDQGFVFPFITQLLPNDEALCVMQPWHLDCFLQNTGVVTRRAREREAASRATFVCAHCQREQRFRARDTAGRPVCEDCGYVQEMPR